MKGQCSRLSVQDSGFRQRGKRERGRHREKKEGVQVLALKKCAKAVLMFYRASIMVFRVTD